MPVSRTPQCVSFYPLQYVELWLRDQIVRDINKALHGAFRPVFGGRAVPQAMIGDLEAAGRHEIRGLAP